MYRFLLGYAEYNFFWEMLDILTRKKTCLVVNIYNAYMCTSCTSYVSNTRFSVLCVFLTVKGPPPGFSYFVESRLPVKDSVPKVEKLRGQPHSSHSIFFLMKYFISDLIFFYEHCEIIIFCILTCLLGKYLYLYIYLYICI